MADLKVAFRFVADAAGLVGGVRVAREELDRLGALTADSAAGMARLANAANDTGHALDGLNGDGRVTALNAHRRATQGLSADMGEASGRAQALQRSTTDGVTAHRRASEAVASHASGLRSFAGATSAANDNSRGFADAIGTVAMGLRGMGALLAIDRVQQFGTAMINAAGEALQLERRLASLVGTGAALRDSQDWLTRTADKLGQSTTVLTGSYTQFLNLARSGLVTIDQARSFTVGMADAQAKYAADSGRMGDVMYGLSQALASPIVHMEELNQVTEPLPGLLLDLDKAASLPTGGFRKLIAEGRVTSEMFRDTLLKALKGYAGEAERASGSIEAAYQRMENAQKRFLANGGKALIDGWKNIVDFGTNAINKADGALSWATRSAAEGELARQRILLDQMLEKRRQLEADRQRYANGAGGVWSQRNVTMTDRQLADLDDQIGKAVGELNKLETKLGDAKDGWAEMWGAAELGTSVTDKLAGLLANVADEAGLVVTRSGLLTKSEVELRTQTDALTRVLALPPAELRKLGISAADATFILGQLQEKLSPVAAAIRDLNQEAAAVAVSPRFRDLYQTLAKAEQEKGRPLTDDESADLSGAWRRKRQADSAEQVRLTNEAATAAERLAKAQASGNPVAIAAANADKQVAEALRDGVIVEADKASYRAAKLRENMAGLAGQAGEAATVSSRQARQMLELAAATARGGEAVAAVTLKHQIENETLKVGAGLRSDLAKRLTEEDAARRKLAAAQFDRDLDMQIASAKALAEAEGRGVTAVAEATRANQVAAQVEKEGVAVDGERAKAIGIKTAELAKWQERQGLNRANREAEDDVRLLQLELSLQGENEAVRNRILELARTELDLRRQFPEATEEELQALLRKHDVAIKLRQDIQQQRGLWDEVGRLGERAFDRIGSAITEAFAQGKMGAISWGSVTKAVMSEVIQAALQLAVINPLKNWATGGNAPSIWSAFGGGQSGAQGQAGGRSPLSSLTNMVLNKGGSWALDKVVPGGLSGAIDRFGYSTLGIGTPILTTNTMVTSATGGLATELGVAAVPGGVSNAAVAGSTQATAMTGVSGGLSAYLGSAGAGAFGGMLGGMIGTATNSKVVGGLSGAALGAGSAYLASIMGLGAAGGPIGLAVAAIVGGVMGMLGTQKKSVGPNSSVALKYSGTGVEAGGELADNGADAGQIRQAADGIAKSVNTIVSGVGARFTGKAGAGLQDMGVIRWFQKDNKWSLEPTDGSGPKREYGSQEEALSAMIKWTLERLDATGKIADVKEDVRTALKNTKATKAEDLANDLEYAANFRSTFNALNSDLDPVNNQIKEFTEGSRKFGEQIKTNLTDWADKGRELGLATEGQLNTALRKGMMVMLGLGPTVEPLRGLAAVTEQAKINFEAARPALGSLGYTAAEQADIMARYIAKARQDYMDQVNFIQRQGAASIRALTDPSASLSMSDRWRSIGLKGDETALAGLTAAFQSIDAAAGTGTLALTSITAALAQLDGQLTAGVLTADQYGQAVGWLTAAWQRSAQVAGAFRQGRTAVEQAIDPNYRPNLDTRLADTGIGGYATEQLRPTFQALLDSARTGTATAAQMRAALGAVDGELQSGRITADQYRGAVAIITGAWQDSATTAQTVADRITQANERTAAASQQLSEEWSSLFSRAAQEVGDSLRTTANEARQTASAWNSVAETLDRARRDVLIDSKYSNLTPEGLRDAARDEFSRLRGIVTTYEAAVRAGTATAEQRQAALDAAGQLDEAGKKYLENQRSFSGDGTEYDRVLNDVRTAWQQSQQLGLTLKSSEERRAEQAEQQLSRLEQLTGLSSAQRTLLDQIKAAIQSGNGDMSQLVTLVNRLPNYQRYSAPADVQTAWNGMAAATQTAVAHQLGYTGAGQDNAFNDYVVATGKQSQFESMIRAYANAGNTPYQASAAAQRAWDAMTDAQRTAALSQFGWSGGASDFRQANYYLVATGQTAAFDAALAARAPAVDNSGATWLADFYARYHEALIQPPETQAAIFRSMEQEKWDRLASLPASAFRPMYDLARSYSDSGIYLNIETIARNRGISGFAMGGDHPGGIRMVGERGIEIEATGAARYWSHEQTRDILSPKAVTLDLGPAVTAIHAVRGAVLEIGRSIADMAARLSGVEDAIDALTREQQALGLKLLKVAGR